LDFLPFAAVFATFSSFRFASEGCFFGLQAQNETRKRRRKSLKTSKNPSIGWNQAGIGGFSAATEVVALLESVRELPRN
jgi:hypothetical protein